MKKTNFLDQAQTLVEKATKFINDNVKKNIELYDTELGYSTDEFFGLPIITKVSKHGFFQQYGVVMIKKVDGKIILNAVEQGEECDEEEFFLNEAPDITICELADLISEKL